MRIVILIAGLWLMAGSFAAGQSTALEPMKRAYHEKFAGIGHEINARWDSLDAGYATFLAGLVKTYQEKGDLDALLAAKAESARFAKDKRVTGDHVVLAPPELTDGQRRYLRVAEGIRQDHNQRIANLTRPYLAELEELKRDLTRRGKLDAAIDVSNEIKATQATAGPLDAVQPVEPAPPKPKIAPPAPAAAAAGTTPGVSPAPGTIKPARNHIWLFVLKDGFPAKDVTFVLVGSVSNRIWEQQPDAFGKLDFRTEQAGESYRVLLISEGYDFCEIPAAKGGEAYQIKLSKARPGTGVIRVSDKTKEITLPGAGKVTFNRYVGGKDGSGATLRAEKKVFRFSRWNPENLSNTIFLSIDEAFEIVDGTKRYEVTWFPVAAGQNFVLCYKPLP